MFDKLKYKIRIDKYSQADLYEWFCHLDNLYNSYKEGSYMDQSNPKSSAKKRENIMWLKEKIKEKMLSNGQNNQIKPVY